jgi:hypothetical protein
MYLSTLVVCVAGIDLVAILTTSHALARKHSDIGFLAYGMIQYLRFQGSTARPELDPFCRSQNAFSNSQLYRSA